MISVHSAFVSSPIFRSMAACAIDPRMSCSQSCQSKEMDSVNRAASAFGRVVKRPERETGAMFFCIDLVFIRCQEASTVQLDGLDAHDQDVKFAGLSAAPKLNADTRATQDFSVGLGGVH